MGKVRLAIFISGKGSNALNIIKYFRGNDTIEVSLVLSNKIGAQGLENAQKLGVNTVVFNNEAFKKSGEIKVYLRSLDIDFIVLSGFLRQIPADLVDSFKNKIINIHPSLLPKFKGLNTFARILKNSEKKTGCTVHYVDEKLDNGNIIAQKSFYINSFDNEKTLKQKTQKLEYRAFPEAIIKIFRNS